VKTKRRERLWCMQRLILSVVPPNTSPPNLSSTWDTMLPLICGHLVLSFTKWPWHALHSHQEDKVIWLNYLQNCYSKAQWSKIVSRYSEEATWTTGFSIDYLLAKTWTIRAYWCTRRFHQIDSTTFLLPWFKCNLIRILYISIWIRTRTNHHLCTYQLVTSSQTFQGWSKVICRLLNV